VAFARRQTSRRRVDVHICYRNEAGEICPPNEKQAIAHASPAEHIFYGGAAGGGKSRWLLVSMLTFAALTKGVECAIFRRRKVELEQSLIPQALAMLPREAISYNGQLGKLEFRHNHSIVWFRYCMRDQDVVLYQSANWKKLGIDEASHMTQHQVDYLSTRVRGNAAQIQVLLGSNPGGPGHGWLKRRFVRPAGHEVGGRPSPKPFEVWRPYPPLVDPTRYMSSRVFIPALYSDNQEMLRFDPRYLDRVLALGGAQSRQLAYGDWDSNDGMMFGPDWEAEHVVRESDSTLLALGFTPQQILPWHVFPSRASRPWLPPPSATIFGSIDYGYGAPWSFHLHAILPGGHIRTFFEFYRAGVRDREQARLIRVAIERLMSPAAGGGCSMQRPQWLVYDPQMDNSREEVGSTESIADVYRKEITEGLNVELVSGAKSSRLSRIQRTKDALAPAPDGFPWWSVSEVCTELIRTLPEMPVDPDNSEDIDESAEDHAWEECGRFLERRPIPPRVNPYSEVDELDPISRAEQLGILQRRDNVATVTPLNVQNLTTR
jgi:hypothetical protein